VEFPASCTLPSSERPVRVAEFEALFATAVDRQRPDTGLQSRAAAKLAEVEARIADLATIRATLHEALAAGCDDLVHCASSSCCPLPFDGPTSVSHQMTRRTTC
jgi:hypothetical protein